MRILSAWAAAALLPCSAAAQVVEYYHTDGLGSVRAVTNQSGAVVERHDYLPFGEEWCPGPPAGVCTAVTPGHPKRFTGKERDAETGLDYFGARYYGSRIARLTTVDPAMNLKANLVEPQRWNRYAYANNNPLRYVDPSGREPLPANLLQFFNAFFFGDFSRADIRTGSGSMVVTSAAGADGVTLGRVVFLSPDGSREYGDRTANGIALVGHELIHVEQYDAAGIGTFLKYYFTEYAVRRYEGQSAYDAYRNLLFETYAADAQADVMAFLDRNPAILKRLQNGEQLTDKDLGTIFKWRRKNRGRAVADEAADEGDELPEVHRPE